MSPAATLAMVHPPAHRRPAPAGSAAHRYSPSRPPRRPARQNGWTLVDLLLGMGLGLFLCATAGGLMLSQWREHQHLLAETLLQQELRNAVALIRHEVHRSGAEIDAHARVPQHGIAPAPAAETTHLQLLLEGRPVADDSTADGLRLRYSRLDPDDSRRRIERGFRLEGTQLQYLLERGWQPWSDSSTVRFLRLELHLAKAAATMPGACPCTAAEPCEPRLQTQLLQVLLVGQSRLDTRTVRSLRSSIHVRNGRLDWPPLPC